MASRPAPQKSIPQFHRPPKVGGKFDSRQGHNTVSWKVVSASGGYFHPRGHSLKNMWRVCATTLTLIFKPPVTEWPPFYFSHFALTYNDPHFQNVLSLTPLKCSLTEWPPFLEIFIGENGRHALTEWHPFSPINDHLVICTQYLFGRRDLCSC